MRAASGGKLASGGIFETSSADASAAPPIAEGDARGAVARPRSGRSGADTPDPLGATAPSTYVRNKRKNCPSSRDLQVDYVTK